MLIFEIWKPIVSPTMRRAWRWHLEAGWTPFVSQTRQRAWRQKNEADWTTLVGERKRNITTCFVSLPLTSFRALSEWSSTRNLERWDRHLSIIKTKRRCYICFKPEVGRKTASHVPHALSGNVHCFRLLVCLPFGFLLLYFVPITSRHRVKRRGQSIKFYAGFNEVLYVLIIMMIFDRY